MNRPLCTQAVAVATILAPMQTLPRVLPRSESSWQFVHGAEKYCRGDCLGTQGSVQLANTTIAKLSMLGCSCVQCCIEKKSYCGVRYLNRPPVYSGDRRGNNSRPHARIAAASCCQADPVAIFAWRRESLPQRPPGYTGVGSTSEHHNNVLFCTNLIANQINYLFSHFLHF